MFGPLGSTTAYIYVTITTKSTVFALKLNFTLSPQLIICNDACLVLPLANVNYSAYLEYNCLLCINSLQEK